MEQIVSAPQELAASRTLYPRRESVQRIRVRRCTSESTTRMVS
jgi:hypothetical protein